MKKISLILVVMTILMVSCSQNHKCSLDLNENCFVEQDWGEVGVFFSESKIGKIQSAEIESGRLILLCELFQDEVGSQIIPASTIFLKSNKGGWEQKVLLQDYVSDLIIKNRVRGTCLLEEQIERDDLNSLKKLGEDIDELMDNVLPYVPDSF